GRSASTRSARQLRPRRFDFPWAQTRPWSGTCRICGRKSRLACAHTADLRSLANQQEAGNRHIKARQGQAFDEAWNIPLQSMNLGKLIQIAPDRAAHEISGEKDGPVTSCAALRLEKKRRCSHAAFDCNRNSNFD